MRFAGYVITTGIMVWGVSIYGDGRQIAFFGIPLSQQGFVLLCLVWYGFDTRTFLRVNNEPAKRGALTYTASETRRHWLIRLPARPGLRRGRRRGRGRSTLLLRSKPVKFSLMRLSTNMRSSMEAWSRLRRASGHSLQKGSSLV